MKFGSHDVGEPTGNTVGIQYRIDFPSGYGASIITGPYTYGGDHGKWELAVMKDGDLNYDTPVTSDVLGWLSEQEVADTLDAIAVLTPESVIQHQMDRARRELDERIADLERELADLLRQRTDKAATR